MKNKGRGLAAIIGGTTLAFSVVSAMIIATRNQEQFKSKAEQIDLVTRLCGGSTDGNIRSFVKDGYTFSFQFSNVTFGTDTITIAAGGYLRCITAFNGLQSIDFGEKLTDLAVSAGKYTSNGVERYHYFAKDYDVDKLDTSYSFASRESSHFALQALDNPVTISSMDVNYSCSGSIDTPTIESLGAGYDNYTWDFKGGGSSSTPFLIENTADWTKFTVTYLKNYTGFYFKLMNDISVTTNNTKSFMGHFDGNGHIITANISGDNDVFGLFNKLDGVGTITNLILEGSVSSTGIDVGGIVGTMTDSRNVVSYCTNRASVVGKRDFGPGVGGVVGRATGGTIDNCINESSNISTSGGDTSAACIGGILGSAYYTSKDYAVTVTNCKNFGSITSANDDIGGIVGFANGSGSSSVLTLVIEGCQNGDETHHPVITGNNHVGGIIGNAYQKCLQDVTQCYIKSCKNYGTSVSVASSGYKTGGIAGTSNIPILNCDNYGDVTNSAASAHPTALIGSGGLGWIVGNKNTYCNNNSSGNANHYSV